MSDFFGKLKSGAGKVAFEAEKMAKTNKAQGELGQLKRQIEAQYLKLGDLYYHHFINQAADVPDFGEICQQISGLEQQVGLKTEELQRISAETYGTPAAAVPIEMVPPAPAHVQAAPVPSLRTQKKLHRPKSARTVRVKWMLT